MSNIVEADPDVAAAMDILSFALYHENNKVVENPHDPASALGQKRQRDNPDVTISSEYGEIDAQRRRVEDADASSIPQDAIAELKQAVYAELSKSLEDSVTIDDICVHIEERDLVLQAIQSLEAESKIMHSEGEVYLID